LNFIEIFEKSSDIKFYESPLVEAELFHTDRRTWRRQQSPTLILRTHL